VADLLTLSSRIIDEGVAKEPVNRITQELSELRENLAVVESFSHVISLRTEDGLVLFDTSGVQTGEAVLESLRSWSDDRLHTFVYTHGHVDHVGGAGAFVSHEQGRGRPVPRVIGHENVAARFDRYRTTNGYNLVINDRQFGGLRGMFENVGIGGDRSFLPPTTPAPDTTFADRLSLHVGGLDIQLRHAKGETDDHLWAWLPERKIICAGDFFIWNFPNAGNPQKVQRYPVEWAAAMREMAGMGAELFVPAHGLPIEGEERIRRVLGEVVGALETVIHGTLEMFVVRNIWRLYGGWYDGNPARLKPAPDAALARELAQLAGGVAPLVERAEELADSAEWRLACHLVEMAVQAAPEDKSAHATRVDIYKRRRKQEASLMAKGIFGYAARQSAAIAFDGE